MSVRRVKGSYRSSLRRFGSGDPSKAVRNSAWVYRNNEWRLIFGKCAYPAYLVVLVGFLAHGQVARRMFSKVKLAGNASTTSLPIDKALSSSLYRRRARNFCIRVAAAAPCCPLIHPATAPDARRRAPRTALIGCRGAGRRACRAPGSARHISFE